MYAPTMRPEPSKCTVTSLPKRELLSLRSVFALPNASSTGDDASSFAASASDAAALAAEHGWRRLDRN